MKFLTILGARPQFIKFAPVSHAVDQYNCTAHEPIESVLVHTGQHYDDQMSGIFFAELQLKRPNYNLGVGSGTHGIQTARMISRAERVLHREKPDLVILYGDTNSTLAGAIAASKVHIPIAHIEAGLRSFNREMPEELNRVITDHVSTIFFAPTSTAVDNLHREGIHDGIHLVGDVMLDAMREYLPIARRSSTIVTQLGLNPKRYCLVTVHRAENTDDCGRLREIILALRTASNGTQFVWPVHPRCRKRLEEMAMSSSSQSLLMISPLSYFDMLALESNALAIVTDSGGVQKEAHWLHIPCVTLRTETEWLETVACGCNRLASSNASEMAAAIKAAMDSPACGCTMSRGESNSSTEIVRILASQVQGRSRKPVSISLNASD